MSGKEKSMTNLKDNIRARSGGRGELLVSAGGTRFRGTVGSEPLPPDHFNLNVDRTVLGIGAGPVEVSIAYDSVDWVVFL
jgi:hypothetical protein